MSNVWFTSDTHFLHPKVAELRGHTTVKGHDETVIARWNAVVQPQDIVWHLGDVGLGKSDTTVLDLVRRLNGRIHLVTGNHDSVWPAHRQAHKKLRRWLEVFESVQAYAKVRLEDHDFLLSHFPYNGDHSEHDRHTQFRLRDEGAWLLHGHIHLPQQLTSDHSVHVGLDAWDMTPVNSRKIVDFVRT